MDVHLRKEKKIGIVGYGIEGKSSYSFLTQYLHIDPHNISIRDQSESLTLPPAGEVKTGKDYLQNLESLDIVIRSSGIQPHLPLLQQFHQKGGMLTSQIEIFFSLYRGKTVAITATKGKTTMAQLTYKITQEASMDSILLGNVGTPALDIFTQPQLPAYAILELSSYMLEGFHPHTYISILGNLYHEHHAQRHGTQQQYFTAKRNIGTHAQHFLVGSQLVELPSQYQQAQRFGKVGPFHYTQQGIFYKQTLLLEKDQIGLLGEHNHYNICAVVSIADILGIDLKHTKKVIQQFTGVEHRLEKVGQYGGITRYNDAIASTPESTIAALKTLPETSTIFLGGKDGDYTYDTLIDQLHQSQVKNIICYPYTGKELYQKLKKSYNCYYTEEFEDGIHRASQTTKQGEIALLSCGSAYTLGIPFEEKGNRFKTYVTSL